MFLRRYARTKNGKKHVYFALAESRRTDAGPRQRVIAHLGELNHDQERRWQRTVVFYNRQGQAQELSLFPDDDTLVVYRQEYGDHGLWVRPKQMFLETVNVEGLAVPRFRFVGDDK